MKNFIIYFLVIASLCSFFCGIASAGYGLMDIEPEEQPQVTQEELQNYLKLIQEEEVLTIDFSSYALYSLFLEQAYNYWESLFIQLDKTNALSVLASTFIVFSLAILAFRLISGKGIELLFDGAISVSIAILAVGFLTNFEIMNTLVFKFGLGFPLEVSSFFVGVMKSIGIGTWETKSLSQLATVQDLFLILDQNFGKILGFYQRMSPDDLGVTASLTNFMMVSFSVIIYGIMFLQFLLSLLLSSCRIILCGMLAPFFGALAVLPFFRKKLLNLPATIFYSWLVIIVSIISLCLFINVLGGMIDELVLISPGGTLLVEEYFYVIIWNIVGLALLITAPGFVAHILGTGEISGGLSSIGIAAGSAFLATKISSKINRGGKGFVKGVVTGLSHKQRQAAKRQ